MGATPIFADVEYETGLLDPKEVEKKLRLRLGQLSPWITPVILVFFRAAVIAKNNLVLVDDASHSLGAKYHGETIGNQADIATFSFHPVKIITTSEGGMLVNNNKKYYDRAKRFRTHGITKSSTEFIDQQNRLLPWYYEMQDLGFNYRLTDIQCALGISQLRRIDSFLTKRREIASLYTRLLEGDQRFKPYREQTGCQSSWHFYPLRIEGISPKQKQKLFQQLNNEGIFPQVHYISIHLHPYYRKLFGYRPAIFPTRNDFTKKKLVCHYLLICLFPM